MLHTLRFRLFLFLSLALLAVSFLGHVCLAADAQPQAKDPVFAVKGTVFDDANANGKQDAGEKGLAGVRVSDGLNIVRTARDGSYTIEGVDYDPAKFVFVVTPSGRRATDGFYRQLPAEGSAFEANFALAPCKESANPRFTFAVVADIHVQGESDSMLEDLAEIAGCKAAFVVAAGDLVNEGKKKEQFECYKSGIDRSPVPVVNCPGNHDGSGDALNYESFLGPRHYSFDYGGCHFVIYDCCNDDKTQRQWLDNDLQQAGKTPVLFIQHYQPSTELMNLLAKRHALAAFSGHWHTTKTFPYDLDPKSPTLYVNTPPLRFGGIDTSARGFVLAHMDRGKLKLEHRFGGVKKHLAIAAPADGAEVPAGALDIRVAAYDSGSPTAKVDYRLDDSPWRPMSQSGLLSCSARERVAVGAHTLTVRAAFADGEPVEKQVKFTMSSSSSVAPISGDDWPMFHHDAGRTGASLDAVKPPLKLAWSQPLGGSAHAAGPVVVGETVYVGIADEDCAGKAGVYALNARTGAVIWRHLTNGSVRNAVAVDSGTVYALATDGAILALDAANGKPRFTKYMNGVARWLFSSPVVKNGVLYAGSGAEFLAFDAKTGRQIWATQEMASDWISCLTSPAVGEYSVLMGLNWSNGLFALRQRTGKIRWNAKKGFGTSHCTPAIVGDRVYHAADSRLYALDAATSNVLWRFPLEGGWTQSSPAANDGKVVVGGPDGKVYCVDAATGKELWSTFAGEEILYFQPYSRGGNPLISSPAISGGVAYCGSGDGKLYAFDMSNGAVLWTYDLGVPITSSPAVSGNAVYVTTFDGTLFAFTSSP